MATKINTYPVIQITQDPVPYDDDNTVKLNLQDSSHSKIIYDIYFRSIRFNLNLHMTAIATNFTSMLLFKSSGLEAFIEFLRDIPGSVQRTVFEIKQNGALKSIPSSRNAILQLSYANYHSPHILGFLQQNSWIDEMRMDDYEFNQEVAKSLEKEFGMKIDIDNIKLLVFSLALYLWIKELEYQLPH